MSKNSKIAMFPGSFNPFHLGHKEILIKAAKIFDHVYVVVTQNPDKPKQEDILINCENIKNEIKEFDNVSVLVNEHEFTAVFAQKIGANYLIRSARNLQDYNYELELAAGNKMLNKNLETILIFPDYKNITFSSTLERHRKLMKK
ncbi:phosphopantetheine adenylyltransferase [Mycoplasma testudineum]|uniref:Pantetheine-phosphate adenylyltransferase n=1 Tax=Mycoplasma testudineum TaxID=244584 RepID=A0A4R6IE91_9MOLU|nr:pantetheine-phosphate adenylyltransferase [Mycoplasma testudineum]OYD26818.1 pantetheine-phosphate adenylyltransferase [Mycoplasma testudineum]TDO20352.1 phosphopantetheine adenylyltransferase [Mycoplasma testudineum]